MLKRLIIKKGFTLVETLVAVSIIAVAFAAVLQAAARSFTYSRYASNEATASFLAQEGLEFVHAIRDGNPSHDPLIPDSWLTNIPYDDPLNPTAKVFRVDPSLSTDLSNIPLTVSLCNGGAGPCPALKLDQAGVGYNYATGVPTPFVREITVSQIAGNEVIVVSKVYWDNRTHSVTLRGDLLNWHPQ